MSEVIPLDYVSVENSLFTILELYDVCFIRGKY